LENPRRRSLIGGCGSEDVPAEEIAAGEGGDAHDEQLKLSLTIA
jgi:hypothetical protein